MSFQGFLKQSTAVDILLGPFLDDTDGKTAETGLTIEDEHVLLSKAGQTLAAKNDTNDAGHDAGGYHNCPLNATDTSTVGQLTITCHMSGALPVRLDYHIVEEAVYDAMYGASATGPLQSTTAGRTLDVNATGEAGLDLDNSSGTIDAAQLGADCITSAKIADDAISAEHINTGALSADAFAADALVAATFATGAFTADAFAADALVAATFATGAFTADAFAADALVAATFATGAFTADAFAADALVAATFKASSLDGKGDWNTTVPDAAGTAATPAEVATALTDINLDHLAKTGDATLTNIVEDNTVFAHLLAIGADISDYDDSTDSLEAIAGAGGGGAPTVDQIRAEMDSNSTQLAAIVADTNELQTDDIPTTLATIAGYLDAEIAQILEDTGTTLPDKILAYFQLVCRSDAAIATDRATELGEIQNNEGSGIGDWSNTGSSMEAVSGRSVSIKDKTDGLNFAGNDVKATLDGEEVVTDSASRTASKATGYSTLDAAGVRTAVGLASANMDTQLAALPTANENADALLVRDMDQVEGSAPEHSLCTMVLACLESSISGTTWTIKRTNGSTTHATKTVTTDADADPITGVT